MSAVEQKIFRPANTAYYWSVKLFPRDKREDIFKLYSFVRVVDDYIDSTPQAKAEFRRLESKWRVAQADKHFSTKLSIYDSTEGRVIKNVIHISRKYAFDKTWIEAFFASKRMDIEGKKYKTLDDMLTYMHGSAETIGLMTAKILELPKAAYETAMIQGRAAQLINFIRDIDEDARLGRCYFPAEELKRFGLDSLSQEEAYAKRAAFTKFVRFQLNRYAKWQQEATVGYGYLPRRFQVPVQTTADMYMWTAKRIEKFPFHVFIFKVRPTKRRILRRVVRNLLLRSR